MKPDNDIMTPADVITLAEWMRERNDEQSADELEVNDVLITQLFVRSLAGLAQEKDAAHEVYGVRINRFTDEATLLNLTDPEVRKIAAEHVADSHRAGFGVGVFAEAALDDETRGRLRAIRTERARLWEEYSSRWPGETPSFEETQRAVDEVLARTATDPIWDAIGTLKQHLIDAVQSYVDAVRAGGCPLVTLAAHLRSIGEHGAAQAAAIENDSDYTNDPSLVWFDELVPGLCGYMGPLANALWIDVVQPQMERAKKNARNVGAVTLGTYGTLEAVMFTRNVKVITNDRQAQLFTDEHLTATAHLSDVALVDVLTKATPALRSYAAAQFLVWIIDEVKRRHFLGYQYPNIVTIEGGLGAVADAAELGASKSRESLLRQILTAGKDWNVAWPNGSEVHGLWTFNTTPPAPGKSATVTITVAAALTPHGGGGGILTPIVSVNDLHGITSKNYLGPLAAFKQGVVKAIVDRRLELPKHGGALITDRELAAIAKRCGVPDVVVPRAMQAWQIDRDEGAQFLEVSKGRIHIADNDEYGAVRAFIDETAAIATTRSARGKRGAAKRAKK